MISISVTNTFAVANIPLLSVASPEYLEEEEQQLDCQGFTAVVDTSHGQQDEPYLLDISTEVEKDFNADLIERLQKMLPTLDDTADVLQSPSSSSLGRGQVSMGTNLVTEVLQWSSKALVCHSISNALSAVFAFYSWEAT
ncbi:unnamed protein product [Sphagnum tenellum]